MPRYYTTEQGKNTEEKNERTERSDTNFFFFVFEGLPASEKYHVTPKISARI